MIQAMDEQPVTCRRCTECIGEEHHYMDDCVNDAGELISLAQTLNFTLSLLQGSSLCLAPPP